MIIMAYKRNTMQKRVVFDIFNSMHNHPSAGMVYDEVHIKYPDISRATVYRLLAEAADEGKILRIKINSSPDRYDFTLRPHYHILCRKCGAVADVDVDIDSSMIPDRAKAYEGFTVEDCHIEFTGLCAECKKHPNQPVEKQ